MNARPIAFDEIQANVLLPYTRANCARLMCFRFDHQQLAAARAFMRELAQRVSYHSAVRDARGRPTEGEGPWWNAGVTFTGMKELGFDPFTLQYLPPAFVDGMSARLAHLGAAAAPESTSAGANVHAVVLCYAYDAAVEALARKLGSDAHHWRALGHTDIDALEAAVNRVFAAPLAALAQFAGVTHVAELDHDAYRLSAEEIVGVEYFGFRDGIANPRIAGVPSDETLPPDAPPGTVLLGHAAPRQKDAEPEQAPSETRRQLALEWLENGSFLVVRNLSQDVEGFRTELSGQASAVSGLGAEDLAEHMMGRRRDGTPLATPNGPGLDDFDYNADPHGRGCPFQAHARRVNPRDERARVHRIMRRGMPTSSYRRNRPEQGLLFLAYNADLEGQFEFVQHQWINAGAESHGLSLDRDPIASDTAPEGADQGASSFSFVWAHDARPYTLTGLHSYVHARWGEYFLVPSRRTLAQLGCEPSSPIAEYQARVADEPDLLRRRDILGRWLDDPEMCRRMFVEVRARGGVVRLAREAVVLVGSADRVAQVVRDDGQLFSVERQGEAMRQTTGAFYLGQDAHTAEYKRDSPASQLIIPGWKPKLTADEQQAELAPLQFAAAELCMAFFGLSVTDALSREASGGLPARGELDLKKFAGFVVAGMTPKLFGVPQASAEGAIKLNVAHSGYLFFAFPEATFLEFADQAARGLCVYLAQVFTERDRRRDGNVFPDDADRVSGSAPPEAVLPPGQEPDERWQGKLNDTLEQLERLFRSQNRDCTLEDKVRLMAGIVSGLLITSFKLFVDGVSDYAKRSRPGALLAPPAGEIARLPFATMKQNQRSIPNIIYRRALDAVQLGAETVAKGDVVLASQGSAMADSGQDWFFGDCTPADGGAPLAPHFCPGYRVAMVLLATMSQMLFTVPSDLRASDDTGLLFTYDWATLAAKLKAAESHAQSAD